MLALSGRKIGHEIVRDGFQVGPPAGTSKAAPALPSSANSRSSMQMGNSPRNGTPSSAARRRAPPEPKMSCRAPQFGQRKKLMFSTMPSTSIFTRRNMAIALTASSRATSCGVQTTTAPLSGNNCESEMATSPVPGGMSITR